MDCMAVQGRVVQRVAMEILGLSTDFRGLITRLVGSHKDIALKMLALEHVRQGIAADDRNKPTHYESRLISDLGDLLGLNCDDIRQTQFDRHMHRFSQLSGDVLQNAASRCRDLFDFSSLLQALVAEFNSFSDESKSGSLASEFMSWAVVNLPEPHVIFSVEDPHRVCVSEPFILTCLESLFCGKRLMSDEEAHNSRYITELSSLSAEELEDAVQPNTAFMRLPPLLDWMTPDVGVKFSVSGSMICTVIGIGFLSFALSLTVSMRRG